MPQPQIVRSPNGCLHCGKCLECAVTENGVLRFTEESIRACPQNLLRISGEVYESETLCERLLKNQRLLQNGGVTFSGGEPLFQSEFVFECLKQLKGKLHTAIQTSGFCSEKVFATALELSDYFLYDLKLIDDTLHKQFTGVSNQAILQNFRTLAKSNTAFTVRTPLIPGVTDTESNLTAIAKLLQENGIERIELLPYNKMAGGKYKMLLREYTPGFDESVDSNPRLEIFDLYSVKAEIL